MTAESPEERWWGTAAVYEVYVRSFADGNGDGIGDLAGVRSRLGYLADLGVDAIWFTPWYRSPMADGGYDVANYREIDPSLGSLEDAEHLIEDAHALGMRILLDIVPNHGSTAEEWFVEALASAPGSQARERFFFRPGRGEAGELAPNDWESFFGGPAWTRVTTADGIRADWYLHLFAPEQPDYDWGCADVGAKFAAILRFWFDRGVDGFRVDSAVLIAKAPSLESLKPEARQASVTEAPTSVHPFVDQEACHDVYRRWRAIADSYEPKRVLVGEVWLEDVERLARYLRPDELHQALNTSLVGCPFDATLFAEAIASTLRCHTAIGGAPTWVLSNHDTVRHVTRYGRGTRGGDEADERSDSPSDLTLGTRRARAAILVTCSLPGSIYVYAGEELGLWNVEDLPDEMLQDPIWRRSGGRERGRDGARVPIPWSGTAPPFGFGAPGSVSWLPQPAGWRALTVEIEARSPRSMLELYRSALMLRRSEPALATGELTLLSSSGDVLRYRRGDDILVVVNTSEHRVALPSETHVIIRSDDLAGGMLAPDSAVWLRVDGA